MWLKGVPHPGTSMVRFGRLNLLSGECDASDGDNQVFLQVYRVDQSATKPPSGPLAMQDVEMRMHGRFGRLRGLKARRPVTVLDRVLAPYFPGPSTSSPAPRH